MRKIESIVLVGVVSFLAACGGGGGGSAMSDNSSSSSAMSSSSSSSSAQTTGSHNAGMDCLASGCHSSGGDGTEFKVAGTVYRSGGAAQTNAEVRLYIHNTNTLSAQMQTDASGNFWTTSNVDGISDGSGTLVTGVDVEVEGPGGIRTMPGLVTNGSCNSCHGNSNGNIVAN